MIQDIAQIFIKQLNIPEPDAKDKAGFYIQ